MYPRQPAPPLGWQQYHNAYPVIDYRQPPGAANGYGWHGNGYGWQLDPKSWHTPPLYPTLNDAAVEEPRIEVQKVEKQNAWFGEQGSGFKTSGGAPQDFYALRDEHMASGSLFEDADFPADDRSLFFSRRADRRYEWKRPHEICDDPQFFVEGYSRFDVQQGELGDCWLLAAAANLTLYNRLFLQIVPDDQEFDDKYAGIFHFRFWQYGKWVDVVIDDRLPTYNGQLIFLHSTEDNEFWSALLEKAYAKLHGSYEALKGGSTCEAMEDFTGGVTEMYEMDAGPPNLFQIMLKAFERASLMGCSIEPDPNVTEAQTAEGLIRGHAYSITRVRYVDISTPNVSGKIPLLRLRNPWGNESEWNGAWGDGSAEWRFISDSEKDELGLTFDNDGEFWMAFKDFQRHFSRVEICNLNPDSLSDDELREGNKKKWEMSVFEGEWVRGVTAGGCRNFLDSFWHNPQYRITLTDTDEDDDEGNCTLIVGLMQKNRRQIRSTGVDLLTIGFAIYHLPYPDRVAKPLDAQFFKYNASVARSPSFINLREVSCRFKLPPGTYCIVPSTFDPNEEGEFLLRVFSEHQNNMEYASPAPGAREADDDEAPEYHPPPAPEDDNASAPYPSYPQPSYPSYPQPGYPQPSGYPSYPQPGGYQPQPGGYQHPQYPGYPGYAPQPAPPPRRQDKGDAIMNFFNKLQNDLKIGYDVKIVEQTVEEKAASDRAYEIFTEVAGEDRQVDWKELKEILDRSMADELKPDSEAKAPSPSVLARLLRLCGNSPRSDSTGEEGFSKDVCRSMIAMTDADRSGKLGEVEFKALWIAIGAWKNVWCSFDADRSGSFSGFELREALASAGYALDNRSLNALMRRYGGRSGEIRFDDFVAAAVKIKTMIDVFKAKDAAGSDVASFTFEEWMASTLYA